MVEAVQIAWVLLQIVIGFHLFFPLMLFFYSKLKASKKPFLKPLTQHIDFAIIITAYEETVNLPDVVNAILQQPYKNFSIYLVADKCDISLLKFNDERVNILVPPIVIGSNTSSHAYAVDNFKKHHDVVTIIDSDNIIDPNYLLEIKKSFDNGFKAVQGLRAPKNLDTSYACLDAARDIYYHFYDGEILFKAGSSATLAGSAMAFESELYMDFLRTYKVSGAGFDKVLQAYIVGQNLRIAINKKAILFDQKTTHSDQLVKQRSRWINTWFKYFKLGFGLVAKGVTNFSPNQFIFGMVLLRPPLFIFLLLSMFATVINLLLGLNYWIWLTGFACFIIGFLISLTATNTDKRIYASLVNIPKFIFFQLLSLSKVRVANKVSVATKHQNTSS